MPLGIYVSREQGRIPATLATHFTLNDFQKLIQKKCGNPDHYDYSLGDVIFRTWNEEVFNRQRNAIRDGVTIIVQLPPVGADGPAWRQPSSGLCYEGVCLNIKCAAFEQKVIMNQGLGSKQVIADSTVTQSDCPLCQKPVQVRFCAFYNCSWRVTGLQQTTNPPTEVNTEWQTVDANDYYRWPENLLSWSRLTIETKK